MDDHDYHHLIVSMVNRWRDHGVSLNVGAREAQLDEFERDCGAGLPAAFRYLYSLANGMTDDMDEHLFNLWPLRAIKDQEGIEIDSGMTKISFGDFLIDSHRYFLILGPGMERVEADAGVDSTNEVIADSFVEFVSLHQNNPGEIHLMPSEIPK